MKNCWTFTSRAPMGASVGAAAKQGCDRVLWVSHERSLSTRKRATRALLVACSSLDELVSECEIILCVCPPHAAEDVAQTGRRFRIYWSLCGM